MTAAARLHELLLTAAGHSPDDLVSAARSALAAGDQAGVARVLLSEAQAGRLPLTPDDARLIGGDPATPGPEPAYDFLPALPSGDADPPPMLLDLSAEQPTDPAEAAAVAAFRDLPGARALWRAWRFGGGQDLARLLIAEADTTDLPAVTAALQTDRTPLIEAYAPATALPDYQRLARGRAALLWSAEPATPIQLARVFDQVHPVHGPLFDPDHPTLTAADRPQHLLDYLSGGEVVLATTERMTDILDPTAGPTVPMSYRTDGTWIWTDTITYYLGMYGLSPDPALTTHIRTHHHALPPVSAAAAHRALAALIGP